MKPLKAEKIYAIIEEGRIEVSIRWLEAEERQLLARLQWLRKVLGKAPLISEDKLENHIEEWLRRNR